jgi:hypothetical protein
MGTKFCPECGERLVTATYDGMPVTVCYDCELVLPMLTKERPYATVTPRGRQATVSRSVALLAY